MTEKLYVCQSIDNKLCLQTRADVDSWIKNAEEAHGSLEYTVVGSFIPAPNRTPYLITFKHGSIIGYEVVIAVGGNQGAKEHFLGLKRNIGKRIEIKRIQDLSSLIKEYYE